MVLTLYYCVVTSPSRAALLAVHACGVNVTMQPINLLSNDHLRADFTRLNPLQTVPVLNDDDEFVVCDSNVIASYMVNQYAADYSLYPEDPKERAIVDQRLYFNAGTLYPKIKDIYFPVLFQGKTSVDENQKTAVNDALAMLDKLLQGNKWVAGENMSIADCACVASVSTAVVLGFDVSKYKNVNTWLSRCQKDMPGYAKMNEPGVKQLGELFHSRVENQI